MIRVNFKNITIGDEIESLYDFIFDCGNWNEYVFKKHPRLERALDFRAKNERMSFIKEYASAYWLKNKKTIYKNKKTYEKNWRQIEKNVFAEMENIVGTKFPENKKITAYISINPICPRFLNKWTFTMFYKFSPKRSKEVIMHECLHFLYFKKWQEMFPGAKKSTFDSPHIIWHLSELAAPIILNDPRMQKYLKLKAGFYGEHEKVKIKGKSAPEFFEKIYKKSENFEDFIKTAYKAITKEKKSFFLH